MRRAHRAAKAIGPRAGCPRGRKEGENEGKTGGEGTGSSAWAMPAGCAQGHMLHPDRIPKPPRRPRVIGSPSTKHGPWGAFRHRQLLSPRSSNQRAALSCSTARGGGTLGSRLTTKQLGVGFGPLTGWKNPTCSWELPSCPAAPAHHCPRRLLEVAAPPEPLLEMAEGAQPIPAPPSRPRTLAGASCSQLGGSPGGSYLSPSSCNPLCPHLISFAFTTDPLEWAQGAPGLL